MSDLHNCTFVCSQAWCAHTHTQTDTDRQTILMVVVRVNLGQPVASLIFSLHFFWTCPSFRDRPKIFISSLKPSGHVDGLQHKGIMSTKPVFEKITKIQRSYVSLCGHMTLCFWYRHRRHVVWLLLTKSRYFAMMSTKQALPSNYW